MLLKELDNIGGNFMKKVSLSILIIFLFSSPALAGEVTGYVGLEARGFFKAARFAEQKESNASVVFAPEYYHEIDSSLTFTAVPFLRLDSADPERTHFDVREFFVLKVFENFEASVGLRKVFWGVTESQHLVDIVNQTDFVEGIDGEEKLGQPMLSVSMPSDAGFLDIYLLPYFRERTFPGPDGRLRSEPYVDTDMTTYESGDEERHVDVAFRYSHSFESLDFALSHFWGTSREPTLSIKTNPDGELVLAPHYEIINQTGLELQKVAGQWLLKFEGIYRSGQGPSYFAATTGFEYTFSGFASTKMDLGLLGELLFDDRDDAATTPMENDLMVGTRLAFNDMADTNILVGVIQDLSNDARYFFVESNRRFGDRVRATLEARGQSLPSNDRFNSIKDDSFIMLEVAYYL
jgi:hypothetical protein